MSTNELCKACGSSWKQWRYSSMSFGNLAVPLSVRRPQRSTFFFMVQYLTGNAFSSNGNPARMHSTRSMFKSNSMLCATKNSARARYNEKMANTSLKSKPHASLRLLVMPWMRTTSSGMAKGPFTMKSCASCFPVSVSTKMKLN